MLNSLNVTVLCVLFSVSLLVINYISAVMYSKYCITTNFWNIIFLAGSPVCQTITMLQGKTLELYSTIWYTMAIAFMSSIYNTINWVITKQGLPGPLVKSLNSPESSKA